MKQNNGPCTALDSNSPDVYNYMLSSPCSPEEKERGQLVTFAKKFGVQPFSK